MVGLVYVCNIVPSFLIKLSAPYWFHLLSYYSRIVLAGFLMSGSFLMVGLGALKGGSIYIQLLGVVMGSLQAGLGETSFLALTAFYEPSRKALTCWGSGTGCAGIFGYAWVVSFTIFFKVSFTTTLLCALILPVFYVANFVFVLKPPALKRDGGNDSWSRNEGDDENMKSKLLSSSASSNSSHDDAPYNSINSSKNNYSNNNEERYSTLSNNRSDANKKNSYGNDKDKGNSNGDDAMASMTIIDRIRNTLKLWPFMVPLFVVYFSEYAMQSGVWSAIGFPISSETARNQFYAYGNWTYQVGVFVSRSSGMLWKADMRALWTMPMLQFLLLIFFLLDAYYMWWYNWALLTLCFIAGLFGGAVYVGGFSLMTELVEPSLKEVLHCTALCCT